MWKSAKGLTERLLSSLHSSRSRQASHLPARWASVSSSLPSTLGLGWPDMQAAARAVSAGTLITSYKAFEGVRGHAVRAGGSQAKVGPMKSSDRLGAGWTPMRICSYYANNSSNTCLTTLLLNSEPCTSIHAIPSLPIASRSSRTCVALSETMCVLCIHVSGHWQW